MARPDGLPPPARCTYSLPVATSYHQPVSVGTAVAWGSRAPSTKTCPGRLPTAGEYRTEKVPAVASAAHGAPERSRVPSTCTAPLAWKVTLPTVTSTPSRYVPAWTSTRSPACTALAALPMVANGCAWVPGFASMPVVATQYVTPAALALVP